MRFKQFLLTEGRSKSISKEKAFDIITNKCSQVLESYKIGKVIYRGLRFQNKQYLSVNPSNFERKSANTLNYYTLLVDNSPYWKDYPKRSKSIICTTNKFTANDYGSVYVVFPYNNAKIGICPANDFWDSFLIGLQIGLESFNDILQGLLEELNIDIEDSSFANIKNAFKQFDKLYQNNPDIIKEYNDPRLNRIFEDYKGEGLLNYFNKQMNPKKNYFMLQNIGKPIKCNDCEVWTDSKCVLVDKNVLNFDYLK